MKKIVAYQKLTDKVQRGYGCGCPMYQQFAMFSGNWALMQSELPR